MKGFGIYLSPRQLYQRNKYTGPPTYPCLYKDRRQKIHLPTSTNKSSRPTSSNKHSREHLPLNDFIDHNICESIIEEQHRQDALKYCPVHITRKKHSLSVIIQNKKTHMELSQYLNAACFPPLCAPHLSKQ